MSRFSALLFRKLLRDLRQGWLSFGACIAMLALSISLFLAFYSAAHSLESSTDRTYGELQFLDFTLQVKNVSKTSVSRVRSVPGVKNVEGRLSLEGARILLDPVRVPPHRSRSTSGRLVGVPIERRARVNDLYVEEGRYLSDTRGQALLERRYALHHGIDVGDTLRVEIRGGEKRFRVVGLVSSPEYVWMAVNRFDPRPAGNRYGVVFISNTDAESIAGGGFVNELQVTVAPEANLQRVVDEAENLVATSLRRPTLLREDQPSHVLVLRDRRAFRGLALLFPLIFLSLSTFTLFSTLWQLVSRQRRQIGIMMSQGCSAQQILAHYLSLGAVIGVIGTVVGGMAGLPLGRACTRFYTSALHLPFVDYTLPVVYFVFISLLSICLSMGASWFATRRVLNLDPVAALRSDFQEGWAPRRTISWERLLPTRLRFALRNFARNPGRSFLAVIGIWVSVTQIVMTLCLFDSQSKTLDYYFDSVHLYDYQVDLHDVMGQTSLPHLASWPEVEKVEVCLRRSAVLVHKGGEVSVNIWGVKPENDLFRLFDREGRRVEVPRQRVLFLGPVQMAKLGVKSGDSIELYLDRFTSNPPTYRFSVAPALHEPLAHPAKMHLDVLRVLAEDSQYVVKGGANILLVKARPGQAEALREKLLAEPTVSDLKSPADMEREVEELLKMFNTYKSVILAFTSLFALVVLLGTTTMTVMDRSREFATLSCLGVSDYNLGFILFLETLLQWFAGLCLGLPTGLVLGSRLMNSFQSQLIQLDLALSWTTIVNTSWVSLLVCLLALGNGLMRLKRIPVTEASRL